MLRANDAGPMFGMGGFQLLPFYAAMQETGLEHHLVNDERSGAFMAYGFARVSNRVGICDATLRPALPTSSPPWSRPRTPASR